MDSEFIGLGAGRVYAGLVADLARACREALRAARKRLVPKPPDVGRAETPVNLDDTEEMRQLLRDGDFAESTIAKYAFCITRFIEAVGKTRLDQVRRRHIEDYLQDLTDSGKSNATRRLHLCALRALFDGLLERGLTTGIFHVPPPAKRPPATPEQVRELFSGCRTVEERFVIMSLNHGELRASELTLLSIDIPSVEQLSAEIFGRADGEELSVPVHLEPRPSDLTPHPQAGRRWVLGSPRRNGPRSARSIRGLVQRLGARRGLKLCTTAVRKAKAVPSIPLPRFA